MTDRVQVTCRECGAVTVAPEDVTVTPVDGVEADEPAGSGSYAFVCPCCGCRRRRPAASAVLEILVVAGAEVATLDGGDDFDLRCAVVTEDDISEIVDLLEREHWLEDQVAELPNAT